MTRIPEEVKSVLRGVLEADDPLPEKEVQEKMLAEFSRSFQLSDLSVGDNVVRTSLGETRYRFPCDGQCAKILSIFDKPMMQGDSDVIVHGEIGVVERRNGKLVVVPYTVDLRYYKKV